MNDVSQFEHHTDMNLTNLLFSNYIPNKQESTINFKRRFKRCFPLAKPSRSPENRASGKSKHPTARRKHCSTTIASRSVETSTYNRGAQ